MTLLDKTPSSLKSESTPRVTVSTFALYDVVRHLAGDKVDLFMIVPFGVDVHSFEPTPKDLARLSDSALFIYSGAGLEPWAESFSKIVKALDISKSVKLRHLEEVHEGHNGHHHGEKTDPHYWLDMANMVLATREIEKVLLEILPEDKEAVHKNSEAYVRQLESIDKRYDAKLSICTRAQIIVNHNAFGYLAHRYGFEVHALTGLSPEAMPSAKTMARLIDMVRSEQIGTIFFESFVSDRLISNIAAESGAKVDVLQPLANITADEVEQGADLEILMMMNLQRLSTAMECE